MDVNGNEDSEIVLTHFVSSNFREDTENISKETEEVACRTYVAE